MLILARDTTFRFRGDRAVRREVINNHVAQRATKIVSFYGVCRECAVTITALPNEVRRRDVIDRRWINGCEANALACAHNLHAHDAAADGFKAIVFEAQAGHLWKTTAICAGGLADAVFECTGQVRPS